MQNCYILLDKRRNEELPRWSQRDDDFLEVIAGQKTFPLRNDKAFPGVGVKANL